MRRAGYNGRLIIFRRNTSGPNIVPWDPNVTKLKICDRECAVTKIENDLVPYTALNLDCTNVAVLYRVVYLWFTASAITSASVAIPDEIMNAVKGLLLAVVLVAAAAAEKTRAV